MHREYVCFDGGNTHSRDNCAKVSIAARAESSSGTAGVHRAAASAWSACQAGVARDRIERVDVHHANKAVVVDHQMAAAPGAKHFGAVFFERDVSRSGGYFLAHDVCGAEASEGLPDGHLSYALLGGVKQEPADKGSPY